MAKTVKREPRSDPRTAAENGEAGTSESASQARADRRVLRSRYNAVKTLISDERDDVSRPDSDKFSSIINEVESLHQLVQKPREQVADAEALLDITNTLVNSVKAHGNEEVTSSDFTAGLLRNFMPQGPMESSMEDARSSMAWKDIGLAVSHVFGRASGCCTMVGPMNTELKQRKEIVRRRHVRPTESAQPEELDNTDKEQMTDTDKNISTMFDILKKNRRVKLENLVLSRNSFSQTVENLFALSFLIKDGRAEITVNQDSCHLVSPRNAPAASAVSSGEVPYNHFVLRIDFKDWKLMKDLSRAGEELMPHRDPVNMPSNSQIDIESQDPQTAGGPATPIRKLTRNRGLVTQERAVVEDSPESDDITTRAAAIRKGKRKMLYAE